MDVEHYRVIDVLRLHNGNMSAGLALRSQTPRTSTVRSSRARRIVFKPDYLLHTKLFVQILYLLLSLQGAHYYIK